ncbi:MAG: alpha/beta fold hydrolase, partial [Anaerolineae bacterium]
WEAISEKLTPPDIDRFPAETMRYLIQSNHKDWDEVGIDGTMANFKELEDGLIRRHLEIPKHMQIVRHLFEQVPQELYLKIKEPVLICAAGNDALPDAQKQIWLDETQKIKHSTLKWFGHTDHDIHIQKPKELVEAIFSWNNTKDKQ